MDPELIDKDSKSRTWIDRVYEPTRSELVGLRPTDDLFLNNGEHLTILQRLGFLSFFVPCFAFGVGMLSSAVQSFRQLDPTMLVSGAVGAGFTYVGFRGLRNALRFQRRNATKENNDVLPTK